MECVIAMRFHLLQRYLDFLDKLVAILVRFLEQNGGVLSKRASKNEFSVLTDLEIKEIEGNYNIIF